MSGAPDPTAPRPRTPVTRVGIVTDTHVGEYLDALPPSIAEVLSGCALIIHAGDISRAWVLDELARIAPVTAVLGDHDTFGDLDLPRTSVVDIAGVRIGVTHGRRAFAIDMAVTLSAVLTNGALRWNARLHRALLRRTGPVDVLIHGHWHQPVERTVNGTLVFCPGAVCPWGSLSGGAPPRSGVGGVVDRVVRRHRRLQGAGAMTPAVGVLEIVDGTVTPRRIVL